MKKFLVLAVCVWIAAAHATAQGAEVSGNVMLTTDYVFRGVTQTQENPAVQGGFDAEWENGFAVGIWGSNVDFDSDGSLELDYYGSYTADLGCEECSVTVGAVYYDYPQDSPFDYYEVYASVGVGGFTGGLYYSPEALGDATTDAYGHKVDSYYPYVEYSHDLPAEFTLDLHLGYTRTGDDGLYDDDDDYYDWSVGVSRDIYGVTCSLAYHDTDINNLYGEDAQGADSRVVFSVSKTF